MYPKSVLDQFCSEILQVKIPRFDENRATGKFTVKKHIAIE